LRKCKILAGQDASLQFVQDEVGAAAYRYYMLTPILGLGHASRMALEEGEAHRSLLV
jgi:hypothetical protein